MKTKIMLMSVFLVLMGTVQALPPVTSGLVMHLDANAITGMSDGAALATWPDLSGNSNDATQTTAINQPKYYTNLLNGRAVVRFDGIDDWLSLNSSMINVGSFTMFLVGKFDRSTGNDMYLVAGQPTSGDNRLRIASYGAQNRLAVRVGNTSDYFLTDAGDRSTNPHVYAINSVSNAWMDGIAKGGATNTATLNPTAFNLGSKNLGEKGFLEGYIAEVVLYNRVLTADELSRVGSYLASKYPSIPTSYVNIGAAHNPNPSDAATTVVPGNPLTWDAGLDLNDLTKVNPDIKKHYVWLSNGNPSDPNLSLVGTVNVTNYNDPAADGRFTPTLGNEKTYFWMIEEGIDNGFGGTYPAGEPNNISGPVWSFTTAPEAPLITVNPVAYIVVDAGEPSLVLSANGINGAFQWYKDGSPIADAVGVYAGTTTNALTIYNVQHIIGDDDEGYYTLKVSNLIGGEDESTPAHVMTKRLTSHYPLEVVNVADGNSITPDIVDGFDMLLTNESASAGLPALATDVVSAELGTYSLMFDNADEATDPNGQMGVIANDVAKYEDITIGVWAKYNGGNEWQRIYDIGATTSSYLFLTPDAGGGAGLRFAISLTGTGGEQTLNAPAMTVGEWTHVAVTIAGNIGRLYVNGELVDTNPGMTLNPIAVTQTRNYVGKSQWSDPEFNGLIDDLKIYNYARSTVQIGQEYADLMDVWVCNNEGTADLTYDFNDDCQVNLADFAMFAVTWLESNRILP